MNKYNIGDKFYSIMGTLIYEYEVTGMTTVQEEGKEGAIVYTLKTLKMNGEEQENAPGLSIASYDMDGRVFDSMDSLKEAVMKTLKAS